MKAALDVHYGVSEAHAVCVVFESWADGEAVDSHGVAVPGARPYRPGRFFERELPPLLTVLERAGERFSHIVIDGYIHLKNDTMGLGAHLHETLPYEAVIVGVAKNPLAVADRFEAVYRGRSAKPLFVSAIGWELKDAAAAIAGMHGPYRIPTLLRLADRTARNK
jgi:deoxyribonuclease V